MQVKRNDFEKDDLVALIGMGPIGKVIRTQGRFVVTERGVYPKISLLLLRKACGGCGKSH